MGPDDLAKHVQQQLRCAVYDFCNLMELRFYIDITADGNGCPNPREVTIKGDFCMDDLYFDLKQLSPNQGAVDHEALIAGNPQTVTRNTAGQFQLFRIGDAVSACNTNAAIFDALRLMKDI